MKNQIKFTIISCFFILIFSLLPVQSITAQAVGFSMLNNTVSEKDTFTVVVKADTLLTGKGVYAFKFGLSYNANYVEFLGIDSVGIPMKNWGIPTINSNVAGRLYIALAGAEPLNGNGNVLYLRFYAKRSGYTTIDNVSSFSLLNEGSPAMTLKSAYVNSTSLPFPDIYPDSRQLYVGETVQMYVSSGTSPFTYGSDNTAIASVDATGKVTATGPGNTKIYVIDAKGNKNYTTGVIDVRAIKLSVVNSGAILMDTFYLPVRIEIAPGSIVYSGGFELTFNSNLAGVKSKIEPVDYPVSVQNNASGTVVKVSFASGSGFTGSGILCRIGMVALNSGTHTINIQNVLCNENLTAFTYSGTVGVECKPCTKVTGMTPETGTENLNSAYFDLYWQPSLNTRYYNLFLWEEGTTMPASATQTYIYGTSRRLYNLKPGAKYYWKIVSINECSSAESSIQNFTTKPLPDLLITNVQAPKEVESGSQFTVTFTVKNTGQAPTVSGQWRDAVYISTDSAANSGKTQLMVKYNSGQLAVNDTYNQSFVITMPAEYTGKYYLFASTDIYNELTELSNDNNMRRFADSVIVALKPFPDIKVKDIQAAVPTFTPGDSLQISWKAENIGNADALGGWSERVTLVSPNGRRVALSPYLASNVDLLVGQTQTRSFKFKTPEVLRFSGPANIEVVLIPSGTLIEHSGTDANNTAFSTGTVTPVDLLFLDVATTSLSEGSAAEVRCVITRSGEYSTPLPVNITNLPTGQITIPASVIIPENMSSEIFNLKAIDNAVVDGPRNVKIVVMAASYRNDTSIIQILDNEATVLKAVLNKTVANEGDSLKLRITRNLVTVSPLTVYLSTDKANQWTFNNAATIPANDSVVIVPVYVINDNSPELNGTASITISSGGYSSSIATATINDDDMPELEFTLTADTVPEAAGMYATYASIKRIKGDGSITLNFSVSVPNTLILPSSITIPNGTNEVKFNIGVVDNAEVDGYRKMEITGSVWVKSCSCNSSPDNGGVITKSLVIADNDGPCLTASVNPVSLFEGKTNAGKLIISRNTETSGSVNVTIMFNDATEIQVQSMVLIPAGQKSVEVPINTINDGIEDGNQTVSITVQAVGFVSGFCYAYVTDLNKPDFVIHHVEVNKTIALTSEIIQVTGRLLNLGYLNAPTGSKVGFYLSKDNYVDNSDQLLGTFATTNQILMGDSVPFSISLTLPSKTGSYNLMVQANPNNAVNELVYTNNTYDPLSFKIVPEYSATAIVDLTQTLPNKPINIYGKATKVNQQPASNVNIDVYLLCNGTRKKLTAITDNLGNYSVQFTPMPDESGHFDIGACYPDEGLTAIQDSFDILGIKRTAGDFITWLTKVGDPYNGTLQIKNTSNIELKNIQLKIVTLPEGCTLTASPLAVLPANATATLNYIVLGTKRSTTSDYQKLNLMISCDEGVTIGYDAYYFCQEQQASLETGPTNISTTVSKGTTKYLEFTLTNRGAGESGIVRILLPSVSFMSLVSSDSIANIKPSESVTVTLKLTDSDLALNTPVNGSIAINSEHGKGIIMPYRLEAVSDAKGGLSIDVLDEYTYNTTEAPHVKNAHVLVRHPYSGAVVADGFTDSNGIFKMDSIPEGYYTMTVEAEKHEGYRNNIIIDAGKTLSQSIFISFQAISYTWEVVRTEVEDEYKVDLIMKYETNVPAPVVVMSMPDSMPQLINDETYPFFVTLTNKGLITAIDVTLKFPNDPEYEFVTNFTKMDLLAQQSIQVPVVMKRKASYNPVNGMQRATTSDLNCTDVVIEGHGFYCGPDKKWHEGVLLFRFTGRVCTGSATGVYTPGGGGGPTLGNGGVGYVYVVPSNNSSTVSVNNVYECDNCAMELTLAVLGCVPGPIGLASGVVACLKSFTDDDGISLVDAAQCGLGFIPGWGCVIGLFGTAYNCYKDPPRLLVRPLRLPQVNETAPKPLMPPIIKQAYADLLWAQHSMDAEHNWMNEITGIDSLYARVNFVDFINSIDSFTVFKKEIQPLDIIKINQNLSGTDILPVEVEAFSLRWNSTLIARAQNIQEPTAGFPDIINSNLLKKYVQQEDSALAYAIGRGYTDIRQMANTAYNTLKEQTETGKKSVCASITLQISQKLVMTREAFEGTLTIVNGNNQNAMTNIKLNLEVKNSQGVLCNDLFQINTKALSILTGIDGTGSLAAGQKGSASILFIPEKGAAPTVPTTYSFGGSFSYIDPFNGMEVTKQLFPVSLDVNPSPDLYLHYFMQRDILADDPLTEAIEPIIPAELALMIQNNGYGAATKVRVESAQPEIIENQKGLAIHLALIGSNLNGQNRQLGLTNIDFGNIASKSTAIGQWWFTADLLGHFVNYETRVVHANSYGNPDLSLISGAKLHELIRSISVYNDLDTIHDFLVNEVQDADETPDEIYTSSGIVVPVSAVNSISTTGTLSSPAYQIGLDVSPKLIGWNYGKVTDPTAGRYEILSVTRQSDGKVLPARNVWQTHVTLPDGKEPVYEHKIHFVDEFASVQLSKYSIKFVPKQVDPPTVLKFENVPSSVSTSQVTLVRVLFEKPVMASSFTYEDMILRCQGGSDLMNNSVTVTQIDSVTFSLNLSSVTTADGYYVLTVQTTGITNLAGEAGVLSKQVSWSQFTNSPAVSEFIGIPSDGGATATISDNLMIRFTVPVDTTTFTPARLIWTRDGNVVSAPVTISRMDTENKLFKIMKIDSVLTVDGIYELTVDLPNIKSKKGIFGLALQKVSWRIDTQGPVLNKITLKNVGGYDSQHVTSAQLTFSEPITGFGISVVELWKDGLQQPVSQMNFSIVNDTTYLITDFRLLTYNDGVYVLKINMANLTDLPGNKASGYHEKTWTVSRNVPASVTEMKISPDLGYSSSDGVTSTTQVEVSMKVNAPKARVRLYYNSYGTSTLLVDTLPANTGTLVLQVKIPASGSMKLQAETVDTLGNTAMSELPVYIDEMPLSANWNSIPVGLLRKHPTSVLLNFSDKILNETILKNNLICRLNGVETNLNSMIVNKNSDTEFAVGNFGNVGVTSGGTFSLSVSTAGLNKYLSGKAGTLSPLAQWILRGNVAPVADAGPDQIKAGDALIMLDGSKSYDADNDVLTYKWTAPAGITLNDANLAKPTFVAPSGTNQMTFSLVVNDGVEDSQTDEITIYPVITNLASIVSSSGKISIYPNPSYNEVLLYVKEPTSGTLNIRIFNNLGQLAYVDYRNHIASTEKYKLSNLKLVPGLYLVDVRMNNSKLVGWTKLIIVNK